MRLGTKIVLATAMLGVLSNPAATATVLGHADAAFTAIRTELRAEVSATAGSGHDAPASAAPSETGQGSARSYAFTAHDAAGRPARWSSCQTIPVLFNPAHAPAGALADLKTALGKINAATGLHFTFQGTTSARPSRAWGDKRWEGRPGGWAPVLVAFGAPGTGPLGDGAAGTTMTTRVPDGGHLKIVTGEVVFNSDFNDVYTDGFTGQNSRGELFLHELGHLAGLGHVQDRGQVMYPESGHTDRFGAGDLAGLKQAGAGGCFTVPENR